MQTKDDDIINKLIFNKYSPEKKIGQGSFGMIYIATNLSTGEKYALKMESRDQSQSFLETEAYILTNLKGYGIPGVKSFGCSQGYNILVMELLGSSLENLFQSQNKNFSLKTVCMIGIQMISRIEWVHSKKIVHRDIKPDNFVIGLNEKSHIIYLLDFGLSKKYWSSKTQEHIAFSDKQKLTGTARYASIKALEGCEQSRRDDLEAIGYVLMYFLRGNLPWQGLKVDKRANRYKKICEKKKNTLPVELCEGFPNEFADFVKYTRNLEFQAEPDYRYLKKLMHSVMKKNDFEFDYYFDWCTYKPEIKEEFMGVDGENEFKDEELNATLEKEKKSCEKNESDVRFDTVRDNYNISIPTLEDNKEKMGKERMKDKDKKDGKKKKKCIIF